MSRSGARELLTQALNAQRELLKLLSREQAGNGLAAAHAMVEFGRDAGALTSDEAETWMMKMITAPHLRAESAAEIIGTWFDLDDLGGPPIAVIACFPRSLGGVVLRSFEVYPRGLTLRWFAQDEASEDRAHGLALIVNDVNIAPADSTSTTQIPDVFTGENRYVVARAIARDSQVVFQLSESGETVEFKVTY